MVVTRATATSASTSTGAMHGAAGIVWCCCKVGASDTYRTSFNGFHEAYMHTYSVDCRVNGSMMLQWPQVHSSRQLGQGCVACPLNSSPPTVEVGGKI